MLKKLHECFEDKIVYKDLKKSNFFSSLGLPSLEIGRLQVTKTVKAPRTSTKFPTLSESTFQRKKNGLVSKTEWFTKMNA